MSLHQLFCSNPSLEAETHDSFQLQLDPDDRKHVKALRLEVGEHIAVVDKSSDYFEVEIVDIRDGELWVRIAQHLDQPRNNACVYLVQGLAKGEKMDTVLRQATELGIAGFVPTVMDRSIVQLDQKKAEKRALRFASIARNASMQSGRTSLPEVFPFLELSQIVDQWRSDDAVLLFWEEAPLEQGVVELFSDHETAKTLVGASRIWIVIGPEGGIAPDEVDRIEQSTARVFMVSLGPTILRTETAGVVSCALVLSQLRALTQDKAQG
ncbi:RsmE family RNA methyltransferase [Anaerotardibacter muris]|uniref:RsmE family RNA methyltransferase n=1 Tax=Anaerotardibacter muris TaxID=2941505 RepID=UPI00203EC149|nr:RsmE family RNA methyltransferase [Anaerotardibacter muris]